MAMAITFTEAGRSRLGLVLGIVNWACILTSLGLVGLGAFIKIDVQEYTELVQNYDGNSLPYLLIGIGLASAITNGVGGFACFIVADPNKREQYKYALVGYLVSALCVCLVVLAGGVMCYTHISHLKESFHGGLALAIEAYKHDMYLKKEVDKLQLKFECCGNLGYTDWFRLLWMPKDYLDLHNRITASKKGYIHDDVPFSCCSVSATRPCINNQVHSNTAHNNYDYLQHLTINTKGCQEALMDYYGDDILFNASAAVFAVFLLQVLTIILVRYLQTSIFEALQKDEPEGPSKGYIFPCGEDKPPEEKSDSPKSSDDEGNDDSDQEVNQTDTDSPRRSSEADPLLRSSRHSRSSMQRSSSHRSSVHNSRSNSPHTSANASPRRASRVSNFSNDYQQMASPTGLPPPPPPTSSQW